MNKKQKVKEGAEAPFASGKYELAKESSENILYNHKTRRKYGRDYLRAQKDFVIDHLGNQHITNELKKVYKKERSDFGAWFERVKKSKEYGNEIHNRNQEEIYQNWIRESEERDAKWLQTLIEVYGEEKAKELHDQRWKIIEERQDAKFGLK